MYLLGEMGFPLNYKFKWWRFGPYSSQMSDIAFSIENFNVLVRFLQSQQEILKKFKEFSKDKENNMEFFEIAASIIYLRKNYPDNFLEKLKKFKPHLPEERISSVLEILKKFNFS